MDAPRGSANLALVVEVAGRGRDASADELADCLTSVAGQRGLEQVEVVVAAAGVLPAAVESVLRGLGSTGPTGLAAATARVVRASTRRDVLAEVSAPHVAFLSAADRLPPDGLARRVEALADHGEVDVLVGRADTFTADAADLADPRTGSGAVRVATSLRARTDLLGRLRLGAMTMRTALVRELLAVGTLGGTGAGDAADCALALASVVRADAPATLRATVHSRRVPRYTVAARASAARDVDDLRITEEAGAHLVSVLRPEAGSQLAVRALVSLVSAPSAKAPEVLRGDDRALRSWFDAARDLLAALGADAEHVDVADVLGVTRAPAQCISLAAVLAGDFDLYRDPAARGSRVAQLRTESRKRLVLDVPMPERLRPLLDVGALRGVLERVRYDADREVLVVEGRAWMPGLPVGRPVENELALRVSGSRETFAVTPAWRPDSEDPAGQWRGFVVDVPVDRLRSGTRSVWLSIAGEGWTAQVRAGSSAGFVRSARELRGARFGLLPSTDPDGRALFTLFRGGLRARLRWRARVVALDLTHAVRRRPLAGVRLARLATVPFFRRRRIWLVGERLDIAQDNGMHLFRHLREQGRKDVYYLLAEDSPQESVVAPFGNVLPHGGLRHRLYLLHAAVLVNSHDIDGYMVPRRWDRVEFRRNVAWRVGARRAFLQHGMTYNGVGSILQPSATGLDLFVSGAAREGEYLRAVTGYGSEVQVTGFPRYDALVPTPPSRTVLFMPTWRRFLVSPSYAPDRAVAEPFVGSVYEGFMRALLTSPALHDALERHDYRLEFFAHYEIVDHVRDLEVASTRVTVVDPQERDVQTAIRECDLMVTDWSSVFFDAAYLGTPIIHAPFDEDDFRLHYREGWFDAERDGFGPVARTPDEVVAKLKGYVELTQAGGLILLPSYGAMPNAEAQANYDLIARRVLPALKAIDVGGELGVSYSPTLQYAAAE